MQCINRGPNICLADWSIIIVVAFAEDAVVTWQIAWISEFLLQREYIIFFILDLYLDFQVGLVINLYNYCTYNNN